MNHPKPKFPYLPTHSRVVLNFIDQTWYPGYRGKERLLLQPTGKTHKACGAPLIWWQDRTKKQPRWRSLCPTCQSRHFFGRITAEMYHKACLGSLPVTPVPHAAGY